MATKTEDSLVFSWEVRSIPFLFSLFISDIFSWMFTFIFAIDFPSSVFVLVVLFICLRFKFRVCFHFKFTLHAFSPFCKNTSMARHFCFVRYHRKCHEAEVFGYDESLWAFPLSFDFMFRPNVLWLSFLHFDFMFRFDFIATLSPYFYLALTISLIRAD